MIWHFLTVWQHFSCNVVLNWGPSLQNWKLLSGSIISCREWLCIWRGKSAECPSFCFQYKQEETLYFFRVKKAQSISGWYWAIKEADCAAFTFFNRQARSGGGREHQPEGSSKDALGCQGGPRRVVIRVQVEFCAETIFKQSTDMGTSRIQ